jgi:acetyl esterase/lipase
VVINSSNPAFSCRRFAVNAALCFAGFFSWLATSATIAASVQMPVSFSQVMALAARSPDLTVSYGKSPSQHAALWIPPARIGGPAPVLVLVHGGCWLSDYSAPHVYPLAARLAKDGYAVYVPEYRRVGETGGGWPGTPADLVRAVDALAALDDPRLELSRTLLIGHSAGGHLALWLAARDPALQRPPLRVLGALGLAAITDLAAYARGDNSCEAVSTRLMGATPEAAPERYAAASPARLPVRVPLYLLRGAEDSIVGAEQLAAMPRAKALTLDAAGHFDWIHPDTIAYEQLLDSIFDLLQTSIAGAPAT